MKLICFTLFFLLATLSACSHKSISTSPRNPTNADPFGPPDDPFTAITPSAKGQINLILTQNATGDVGSANGQEMTIFWGTHGEDSLAATRALESLLQDPKDNQLKQILKTRSKEMNAKYSGADCSKAQINDYEIYNSQDDTNRFQIIHLVLVNSFCITGDGDQRLTATEAVAGIRVAIEGERKSNSKKVKAIIQKILQPKDLEIFQSSVHF